MSWSDDEWGKPIFPTRFGSPQGHATERKMLDAVGGFDGIRTKIRTNPDGSTTILKTRGGMPVFTTTQPPYVPRNIAVALARCAAIPVSGSGPWGFSTTAFSSMSYGYESDKASAELSMTDSGAVSFAFNKRWATGTHDAATYHPGNKTWFDSRTTGRATDKVVSWWSPFDTCLRLDYSWYSPDSPWIGETGVSAQRITAKGQAGKDMSGTWGSNKGLVFIDGVKVCDFDKHILAAAYHNGLNAVFALTTETIELSIYGDGISTTPFYLKKYDIATGVISDIANLGGAWWSTERCPNACFSPSAEFLLAPLNIPTNYQPSIYKVVTQTGVKELLRPVAEDFYPGGSQWQIRTTLAMRFAEDDSVIFSHEDVTTTSTSMVKTINIEGVNVATATGTETWVGSAYTYAITGDIASIVHHDGFGGYLIAIREGFSHNESGDQLIPNSASWASSHPGSNCTRYSVPAGNASELAASTTDVPVFFAKAGQPKSQWVALPTVTLGQQMYGDETFGDMRTMMRSRVDAYSNIAPDGGPNQKQLFTSVAVDPVTHSRIVTARISGGVVNESKTSEPTYMYAEYQPLSCALLINAAGQADPISTPWGGQSATIHAPVFFTRVST